MTIDWTTSPGGLFRRIGRIGGLLNSLNSFRGTADLSGASIVSLGTGVDNIHAQFLATSQNLVDGLYAARDSYRAVHDQMTSYLRDLAESVVIKMADDDNPLPSKDIETALKEVVRQMVANSQSVDRGAVTVSVAAGGSNTGTGVCRASVVNEFGATLAYPFDEDILVTCTADAQGSATEGQETFDARGEVAEDDPLSWNWEKGSGASASLTAVDAATDAGANLLTNSSFEDFTTNVPDNWTVLVGVAGTDFGAIGAGSGYDGAASPNALRFTGDGSTLASLAQTFNSDTGTVSELEPNTVYAVNFWAKRSNGVAAGVLDVELVDGSNTVINDDAGTANQVRTTISSGFTTSWAAYSGFFRTPRVLPSTIKMRVRLSTALTNAETTDIDHLAMTPATQLYSGGPFVSLFSGATAFIEDDVFTVTVANDYTAAMHRLWERLFGLRELGLQLPDNGAGAETIADSLVS